MNPVVKYQDDFNQIVELVWQVYKTSILQQTKIETRSNSLNYLSRLKTELLKIKRPYYVSFYMEKKDLRQQLSLLWIEWTRKFQQKKKRKTSLRDYLLTCSIWGMKSYLTQCRKFLTTSEEFMTPEYPQISEGFSLNLIFVIQGSSLYPFDRLSPYERYLLFLKYKEEKTTVEIAYVVQKHRQVVAKQLNQIVSKLRSLANGS